MGKNAFNLAEDARYDPKYGINGRVKKGEFSIDGKSWNYRDPQNKDSNEQYQADRRGDSGSAEDNWSKNAYQYTNPLYDYSYGQVRDAAKATGITNVNSQGEVDQLLKQIRGENKPKAEEFKDDFVKKKVKPKPPVYGPKKSFTYNPDTQAAFDREEARQKESNSEPSPSSSSSSSSSAISSASQVEPFVTTDFKSQIKKSLKPNLAYSLDNAANTLRETFMRPS